ncbi:unnamed protein product [Scytosiphon promiscuus]
MVHLPLRLSSREFGSAARVAARVGDKQAESPCSVPGVPVPAAPDPSHSPEPPIIHDRDSESAAVEGNDAKAAATMAAAAAAKAAVGTDHSTWCLPEGDPTPPLSPPPLPSLSPPSASPTPSASPPVGPVPTEEADEAETPPHTPTLRWSGATVEAIGRTELWRQMVRLDLEAAGAGFAVGQDSPLLASIAQENASVLDQGMVLPCAPSDVEKVMYHSSGRSFLVILGVVCVGALMSGMWLFTLAAPFFYWFGAPTAFIMMYLLISYFGVAVWGDDFNPTEHENKVSRAEQEQFWPSVDVFLPVCGEPTHLLDNTWKHVRAMEYRNIAVHVLDDGAKEEVRVLAALYGFNYIRRSNRPELKKAGNLRYAFARTFSDLIVIFDADFCPRAEFLKETTPYFMDREIAILQTPQFFRYRDDQTWVEKGAGVTQELFYRMVQVNRNKFDAAICVGTCGVYRRDALAVFGGTAAIGYSEDVHTGFNCTTLGYKVKYIPQILSMGTCPDEPRAFFMQQYRWCMGSTTLLSDKHFWRSSLTGMQKLCYLSGMFYYSATAMGIFLGPLPGILLLWFKPSAVFWFNISFALPSIFFGIVVMRIWSKQPFDLFCQRAQIIQSYAHLYAIKDKVMRTAVPWVPTGGGASSRSSSQAYDSSVKLMLCLTVGSTLITIGSSSWRSSEYSWFNFMPTVALSVINLVLSISTLL